MSVTHNLDGIWAYDQREVPLDYKATKAGHTTNDGESPLHGSWTQMRYFIVRMEDENASLIVIDQDGNFCRFKWSGNEAVPAWLSCSDRMLFEFSGKTASQPAMKAASRTIYPSLLLDQYTENDYPSNKSPGDLYIKGSGTITPNLPVNGQTITYHPVNDIFYWSDAKHSPGLVFNRVHRQEGVTEGVPFSDTFAGKSEFTQTAFPFYGYDPRHMAIYSEAGLYQTPGTSLINTSYASNPGQTFIAPLIFKFPKGDSHDYSRYMDIDEQPNLPLGRYGFKIEARSEKQHSVMLKTIADRMDSWSMTLGLSAGTESMLAGGKLTRNSKIEEHHENESRYIVARSGTLIWVNIIHIPSLQLKEEFINWIKDLTYTQMSGSKPDWKSFVDHFGTHYLHAMTQGNLKYSETRLSMQTEVKALSLTSGLTLNALSKSALANGKGKAGITNEWSKALGSTIETQDVQTFSLGEGVKSGVSIFYDLRPMTELLSPLLFPYNPADEWAQLAPWVWSDVRQSFADYLQSLGLNQPLDKSSVQDYTPRLIRVTFPNVSVSIDDRRWMGSNTDFLYAKGSIKLMDLDGDPNGLHDAQFHLSATHYEPDYKRIDGNGDGPTEKEFSCILALRKNAKPRLRLDFNLDIFPATYQRQRHEDAFATFSGPQVIDCAMNDKVVTTAIVPYEVTQSRGLSIYYTLHVQVRWEEIGLMK